MKKKLRFLAWGVLAIIICVAAYYVTIDIVYSYHLEFYKQIPLSQMFTDSARENIDTLFLGGSIRKGDKIYTYIYSHIYYIEIWEIKSLKDVDLKEIAINKNAYLSHVELYPGEILDAHSFCETHVKFGPFFKDKINIELDQFSGISKTIEGSDYRGFYGTVGRMAFENGEGQILAFLNYTEQVEPTLFLMYKTSEDFYMITINSDKPFDESIMNILSLR